MLRPRNRPVYAKYDANYRGFCTRMVKKQKARFSTKSTDMQWIMTNFAEFRSRNNKAQRATRGGGPMASRFRECGFRLRFSGGYDGVPWLAVGIWQYPDDGGR